jgi:hypothetical protein
MKSWYSPVEDHVLQNCSLRWISTVPWQLLFHWHSSGRLLMVCLVAVHWKLQACALRFPASADPHAESRVTVEHFKPLNRYRLKVDMNK